MALSENVINWIVDVLGSQAVAQSNVRLQGSTSSILHRIMVEKDAELLDLVIRQFNNEEWLKEEPDVALHEAMSLRYAANLPIKTPDLIAFKETGDQMNTPVVLMTMLEGTVELKPTNMAKWVDGLAEALTHIHRLDATDFNWTYFTYQEINAFEVPKWSRYPELWKKAIHVARATPPEYTTCFIHRDYHPTNVLFKDGEVSGIVDWVNACRGPAGIDIGHCRVNLAMLYNVATADKFLTAYQAHANDRFIYNVYWDIISLIDILEGPPVVYSGWEAFGVTGLTDDMMMERLDDYLVSLMDRL